MQLRLPWGSVPRTAGPVVTVAGRAVPILVVRHPRARRYLLRVTSNGSVRLTVPPRGSVAEGLRFAARHATWLAGERQEWLRRHSWRVGTPVWFRGMRVPLERSIGELRLADFSLGYPASGGTSIRTFVEGRLRHLAAEELIARCGELAQAAGVRPRRVLVRDQRSRWGSCARSGTVSLNWRLVQMPPAVRDYVIQHELAHLGHPNHSRRFWQAVGRLCPDWRASERWLRQHGAELL